jgi:hypothetical protein
MTAFAIDFKKSTIRAFTSSDVAHQMGNGLVVFTSASELLSNRNTTGRGLVEVYNNCVDKPITKFSDTKTGADRIVKLAQDIHVESTPFDKAGEQPKVVRTYKLNKPFSAENMGMAVVKTDVQKPRGKYAGKSIRCLVEKNPRREGTKGFHSMGILINSSIPVSYENYISEGGRPNDLAYDIEKGNVELV